MIQPDPVDNSQVMGDQRKEITDEERDQSDEKRSEAMRAFSEQKYDEAIKLYTEAIQLNPESALLFAKRGQVSYKLCFSHDFKTNQLICTNNYYCNVRKLNYVSSYVD